MLMQEDILKYTIQQYDKHFGLNMNFFGKSNAICGFIMTYKTAFEATKYIFYSHIA